MSRCAQAPARSGGRVTGPGVRQFVDGAIVRLCPRPGCGNVVEGIRPTKAYCSTPCRSWCERARTLAGPKRAKRRRDRERANARRARAVRLDASAVASGARPTVAQVQARLGLVVSR